MPGIGSFVLETGGDLRPRILCSLECKFFRNVAPPGARLIDLAEFLPKQGRSGGGESFARAEAIAPENAKLLCGRQISIACVIENNNLLVLIKVSH